MSTSINQLAAAEFVAPSSITSVTFSGHSDECTQGHLKIQVLRSAGNSPAEVLCQGYVSFSAAGRWSKMFTLDAGDYGSDSFHCDATVFVSLYCDDQELMRLQDVTIRCHDKQPCPPAARVTVTDPSGFVRTNPADGELECLAAGNYVLRCTDSGSRYDWFSNDIHISAPRSDLKVVSVDGDTMVVYLGAGDNWHFRVQVSLGENCSPSRTIAFHCGGMAPGPTPAPTPAPTRAPTPAPTVAPTPGPTPPKGGRPWYCAWLEAIWMLSLVGFLLCVGLAICEVAGGVMDTPIGGPFGGIIAGLVLVGFEILVSQLLTFMIIGLVAAALWARLCRPSACRWIEDLQWCLAWSVVFNGVAALFCPYIGPYSLLVAFGAQVASSAVIRRRCNVLDPFSLPWLRG